MEKYGGNQPNAKVVKVKAHKRVIRPKQGDAAAQAVAVTRGQKPKPPPTPTIQQSMQSVANTVGKAKVRKVQGGLHFTNTPEGRKAKAKAASFKDTRRQQTERLAPVLTVLEQTTRPLHAVAGATDAAIQGKNVARAAKRGIQNKDKTTFGTVLKHAGVPKGIAAAAGFGLDVVADPTTYIAPGAIVGKAGGRVVAEKAAATAGGKAVRRLARDVNPNIAPEGVSKQAWDEATSAARTTRATVGRKTHEAHQQAVAIRKAIGKDDQRVHDAIEADTIGQLPAHLQTPARHLKESYAQIKAAEQNAGIKGGVVREMKPVEVPKPTMDVTGAQKAVQKAQRARYSAERVTARDRPAAVRKARKDLRTAQDDLGLVTLAARHEHVAAKQAVRHNELAAVAPKSYVPHYTTSSLEQRAPSEARGSVGKRVIAPSSSKARAAGRQKPLADLRQEHPDTYNEDAALAYVNRMVEGHRAVAQADLNKRLADLGLDIKPGEPLELADNEAVFRQHGSDLTEVTDKPTLRRVAEGKGGEGRFVVLNRDVVSHAHAISRPGSGRSEVGKRFDQVQGGFKFLATQPNPGFHIRNLVGDTMNAYLGQGGHRLPGNYTRSAKALKALKRDEEAQRTLGAAAKPVRGRVKVKGGGTMTYEELAQEAARTGAIRSGFTNRELHDLLKPEEGVKSVKTGSRVGRAVKRTLQSREDLPRLATYIEARRRGMTAEEAARYSSKFHFDYANLTEFERKVARRVVPFYTFSSRNIPLQAKMLVQRPGKYANFQKVREEASQTAGLDPSYEKDLTPWEQRNAPIPISVHGKKLTVSAGLPLTDLNEIPTTANPAKLADEYLQKGMSLVSPIIKDPVELWANYSFFFRDQIKRSNSPLVAAPSFVGSWPKQFKDKFHIVQIIDKRTGKKEWAWDAKANYIAHAIPGLTSTGLGLASGTDRAGRGTPEKVISALGVKTAPVDPTTSQINRAYDELNKIQTQLGALSQQGIKGAHTNAERAKLNLRSRELERQIYQLSRKRGDKVLPTQGGPRRARQPAGGLGGGLGGSLGGGLGGGL